MKGVIIGLSNLKNPLLFDGWLFAFSSAEKMATAMINIANTSIAATVLGIHCWSCGWTSCTEKKTVRLSVPSGRGDG